MGHLSATRDAWKAETERRKTAKKRTETEFLPAALEIMETPPRPLGRAILWLIIAAAVFALVWAFLAKVDIVAVAEGRIVPRGRLQSVETSETGIVRKIFVTEGETVTAGQPLIQLDPTYADADANAARSELATARLQEIRSVALLAYSDGEPWSITPNEDISPAAAAAEESLVTARIREYQEKLASLDNRREGARLAQEQAYTEVYRIDSTLPIIERQLEDRRELANKGYAPRLQVEELEERVTTLRFQRRSQMSEISKAESEMAMLTRDMARERETFRASASVELSEARAIIATRGSLVEKAERREALQTLTAPVSGTVNEIAITTIGEVAEPGQPLITIVPSDDELIIEAFLLNRDVGFVKTSQPVIIKLEAFPFMRYGYLEGEIENVSPDAIMDEARGLVYPAKVRITGSTLRAERLGLENITSTMKSRGSSEPADADRPNRDLRVEQTDSMQDMNTTISLIQPGMSVTAEVKTGERSVISYLLSPIAKAVDESGRER